MDIERTFLSKAIQSQKVQNMILKGISSDHFVDEHCQIVWDYCNDYIQSYKAHPSLDAVVRDTVHEKLGSFKFEVTSDSLDYLFDEFTKLVIRRQAITGLMEIGKHVDDPEKITTIGDELIALGTSIEGSFLQGNPKRFSDMHERISDYEYRKMNGTPYGIQMGIKEFDELTLGIQPHELVIVAGFLGMGKSTISQYIAFNAYLQGYTPLIVSLEMEASAVLRKFDTMATHFKYNNLKALQLNEIELAEWEQQAIKASGAENDIVVLDDVDNCTIEKIYSIGKQYKPDLLIIDYLTLMTLPGERAAQWEKISNLSRSLKKLARDPDFPAIIAVAQSNGDAADEGSTMANMAFAKAIGMDADIAIGLHQTEEMYLKDQMEARLMKNRDGKKTKSLLHWKLEIMLIEAWQTNHEFSIKDMNSHYPAAKVEDEFSTRK